MNKVISVNLNGRAYQVEEQAYERLRAYLDEAARLLADDPDCREILADLEQAIGDKGARHLGAGRNVLNDEQMKRILDDMGPVEAGEGAADGAPAAGDAGPAREPAGPKRLYLVKEGEMIAGVCNGLAAYFGVDPTIVRLVFVILLFLSGGLVAFAYLVLMFVVPEARTAEQRAAARGLPFNAQELVDQAKRHYAGIKDGHHRWREKRLRIRERAFWRPREQRAREEAQPHPFERPQPGYGTQVAAGFVLPLLSVISAALTVACLVPVASLLSTGEVLGWRLPLDVPPWAAMLALVAVFALVTAPLRAVRHATYEALGSRRGWFVFWDGVLRFALVVLALWFVVRFVPGADDLFRDLSRDVRGLAYRAGQVIALARLPQLP
jgi:phage shock protein PspC (stress-responsive transcriptional regulator)